MPDSPAPVASRRGGASPAAIPGLLIPVLPLADLGDGGCPDLVLHVDLVGQLAEDVVNVVVQDHPVASSTGFSGPGRSRPVSALARERGGRGRARNTPDLGADRLVHVAGGGIAVGSGLLLEVRTGGTGGPVPEGVLRFRAGRQTVVKFANHLVQQVEAGPDIVTEKSNKIN